MNANVYYNSRWEEAIFFHCEKNSFPGMRNSRGRQKETNFCSRVNKNLKFDPALSVALAKTSTVRVFLKNTAKREEKWGGGGGGKKYPKGVVG